jgi:uncharacterized protein YndB with AHSA1/START domain
MGQSSSAALAPAQVLEITRTFAAPRALVFRMWSRPEFLVRWWGPEGQYLSRCEMDFRVGGKWRYAMQSVGGASYLIRGMYREIVEPSRLVLTYGPDEDDGFETAVEIDLIERGNETQMRFRQAPFPNAALRDGHIGGWSQTFGLLADYLRRVEVEGADTIGEPRSERTAPDIVVALRRLAEDGTVPEQGLLDRMRDG